MYGALLNAHCELWKTIGLGNVGINLILLSSNDTIPVLATLPVCFRRTYIRWNENEK